MNHVRTTRRLQAGMSLVEVLVATVIFVVGILGLLSANATALSVFSDARFRVDAALLADRLISEAWVDRVNVAAYAYAGGSVTAHRISPWLTDVQRLLPGSDAIVQVVGTSIRVTVSWQTPNGERHQHSAVATLQEP
ncbi:MAG: prepilin-type N-terminal cleavage/methylation domain-containing protein [Burkholderiaceae bacterium]